MQGHASQRQDEVPPLFRRQTFPKNRGQLTELVHRGTQANVPTRAVLGIQFSAISQALSNYQRHFVWGIEPLFHLAQGAVKHDIFHVLGIRKKWHQGSIAITGGAQVVPMKNGLS
jgi:hypothetical protein